MEPTRLVALLAALLMGAVLVGCGDGPGDETGGAPSDELSGYTRDPAPDVSEVVLPAAPGDGEVGMVADPGGLRVVYFGYTSCPDVCPTTMADLKRALASLPEEQAERVSFVMVTVDPERDVPEKMEAYVTTFIEGGEWARTEDDALLRSAAQEFGADYAVTTTEDGEIEVSHSAELYAVDDTGEVVLQWPFGISAESLASDIAALLEGQRA